MDITKDIQLMTTFRNHSAVVQNAETDQSLLDLAAEANPAEGIRQGLEDFRNGRTRGAADVCDEIRADYGISR